MSNDVVWVCTWPDPSMPLPCYSDSCLRGNCSNCVYGMDLDDLPEVLE